MIRLRPFRAEDVRAVLEVYRDAILTTGATVYAPEQVNAWAGNDYPPSAAVLEGFGERMARGLTLVAEDHAGEVVAFGQLDPVDHVHMLFCRGTHGRRGIAARIYNELERHARGEGVEILRTEASRIARPFFAKHGFTVVEEEVVTRQGVEINRFRMEKRLDCAKG